MNEQTTIPRWRGFNLMEMGGWTKYPGEFRESDFRWMADWGFDFVRIPSNYTLWTDPEDIHEIDESKIGEIDRVIDLGDKYDMHVNFAFHNGPGYCVNHETDPAFNLWQTQAALDAFIYHWESFAKRYSGIPSDRLSFNLINEPRKPNPQMSREDHERVIRSTVGAIRSHDPDRLIVVDGLSWGNEPCPELMDLNVVQSTRAYQPMNISHYKTTWIGDNASWSEPSWPGRMSDGNWWDQERLREHYRPWIQLAEHGVGVHCGEGGAYKHTPHEAMLAWLRDVLEIFRDAGIGYALWNFRGNFGILDSGRTDVEYEDWYGHRLDRRLLSLLQEF